MISNGWEQSTVSVLIENKEIKMARKIKRFFIFMFFSLFFSMLGGKKDVPSNTQEATGASVKKSVLPVQIGGSTAQADWYCT